MLRIHKLADKTTGVRVPQVHPMTGETALINPETGAAEPWPLAGVRIVGDPAPAGKLPARWVNRGVAEGWLSLVNPRPVHRPGGPDGNRWATTHTFIHADAVVVHTTDGDVTYRVTHQPDKYVDGDDPAEPVTDEIYAAGGTRVDWFYGVELEG